MMRSAQNRLLCRALGLNPTVDMSFGSNDDAYAKTLSLKMVPNFSSIITMESGNLTHLSTYLETMVLTFS